MNASNAEIETIFGPLREAVFAAIMLLSLLLSLALSYAARRLLPREVSVRMAISIDV